MEQPVWIEISQTALKRNLAVLRRQIGLKTLLAPCLKANAYGHGLVETGKIFLSNGADWLAVNSLAEAQKLRTAGITKPLLLLGYLERAELQAIPELNIRTFVFDPDWAKLLSQTAEKTGRQAIVHLKIDTGMHRQGIFPEDIPKFAKLLEDLPGLKLEGAATHFADSDNPEDQSYFQKQLRRFLEAKKQLENLIPRPLIFHFSKSDCCLLHPEKIFGLARPGIAAYGYYPGKAVAKICQERKIFLEPALSLKTKVAQIKKVPAGSPIGYGRSYQTGRPSRLAILPIGYSDGLDRRLSNRGKILIKEKKAPIVGRVCMNITIVDITEIKGVAPEDEAVIIGRQGRAAITPEDLAEAAGTINYEIVSRLREGIIRRYQ